MMSGLMGRIFNYDENSKIAEVQTESHVSYEFKLSKKDANSAGKSRFAFNIHVHQRPEYDEWFGFLSREDRDVFRELLKMNKVGPAMALLLVESFSVDIKYTPEERLKSIKGIGDAVAKLVFEHYNPKPKPPTKRKKKEVKIDTN